jgi:four helix bundle protein
MKHISNWKVSEYAFKQQSLIFNLSKAFPKEETYSLTSQIRRSSRSVYGNLAEAFRKRLYPPHLVSKLSDADAENSETEAWLEIAIDCNYINELEVKEVLNLNQQIGKLLFFMIHNSEKFVFK